MDGQDQRLCEAVMPRQALPGRNTVTEEGAGAPQTDGRGDLRRLDAVLKNYRMPGHTLVSELLRQYVNLLRMIHWRPLQLNSICVKQT
jgi:hypothetical protein